MMSVVAPTGQSFHLSYEILQHLFDGLAQNLEQVFMVTKRMNPAKKPDDSNFLKFCVHV